MNAEPTTTRLAKGSAKARATRAALIDLAAELFAEQGYAETSIRDIARRGALTSGALYGHFRNKADLLVAAINQRTTEELEAQSMDIPEAQNYVKTLTRLSKNYPKRRRLRTLIVQGAAAAQTDSETRERLRDEQLSHLEDWIAGYEQHREAMGIDAAVDLRTAVIYTWAVEVGLGVLESMGIEPQSAEAWADMANRFARSLQLAPEPKSRTKQRSK